MTILQPELSGYRSPKQFAIDVIEMFETNIKYYSVKFNLPTPSGILLRSTGFRMPIKFITGF